MSIRPALDGRVRDIADEHKRGERDIADEHVRGWEPGVRDIANEHKRGERDIATSTFAHCGNPEVRKPGATCLSDPPSPECRKPGATGRPGTVAQPGGA